MHWTPMDLRRLRNLIEAGNGPERVSDLLGHSVEAVVAKAKELTLEWDPRWQIVAPEEN